MPETARRLLTWEDLVQTPDDGRTYEVIHGGLEAMPLPRPAHSLVQVNISGELWGPFHKGRGGPGGWWILIAPGVRLATHEIVAPDLVGWRRERLPRLPEERPIDVRPDWVCEVLSPSHLRRDRVVKADLYQQTGIPHLWLVDPEERLLEAFELRQGAWVRLGAWGDDARVRIPPFDAVELDVGSLFPERPPAPASRGPGEVSEP